MAVADRRWVVFVYPMWDPDGYLEEIRSRQAKMREEVRREAEARRGREGKSRWSFATFKLWRVHVFIGFERERRVDY